MFSSGDGTEYAESEENTESPVIRSGKIRSTVDISSTRLARMPTQTFTEE